MIKNEKSGFPFLFSVTETVLHLEIKDFSLCGLGFWLPLLLPWITTRSNKSILKEINPEYSLEGLVLKLRDTLTSWCEDLTHWKRSWCWERLRAGGEGGNRGRDGWMASLTQWRRVWVDSGSWWWAGRLAVLWSMGLWRVRYCWVTELNWSKIKPVIDRTNWKSPEKEYGRLSEICEGD